MKHDRTVEAGHLVRRGGWLAVFCAFLVSAVFTVSPARAEKFVIAWSAVSALNSPFWVMNDAGLLKQEGLDMQLVYIASSPTVAQATLAGDIVLSGANSQVIVDAGLNGGDLVAMGAITNVVAFYIMAAPEIKTVADLRGKMVGVTRFGASTDFGMRMLLSKYGLEAVKDVPFIQIGGMPELAGALWKKTLFAAPMSNRLNHGASTMMLRGAQSPALTWTQLAELAGAI